MKLDNRREVRTLSLVSSLLFLVRPLWNPCPERETSEVTLTLLWLCDPLVYDVPGRETKAGSKIETFIMMFQLEFLITHMSCGHNEA
jgi:hypothetical protein